MPSASLDAPAGRRMRSTLVRVAAARARSSGPIPSGIRASRSASTPQGPGCSTRRKERTVDAVPAIDSLRSSLAAAQRKLTRTSFRYDPEQPLADQSPGQHQAALLVERQVARPQLGAATDLLESRPDPGRHLEDPVAEGHLEPVLALRHEDAGTARPPAQQGVLVDRVEDEPVHECTFEPGRTRGEEPPHLLLQRGLRVDLPEPV